MMIFISWDELSLLFIALPTGSFELFSLDTHRIIVGLSLKFQIVKLVHKCFIHSSPHYFPLICAR